MNKPIFLILDEYPNAILINEAGYEIAFEEGYSMYSIRAWLAKPLIVRDLLETAQFSWVTHVIPFPVGVSATRHKSELEAVWKWKNPLL